MPSCWRSLRIVPVLAPSLCLAVMKVSIACATVCRLGSAAWGSGPTVLPVSSRCYRSARLSSAVAQERVSALNRCCRPLCRYPQRACIARVPQPLHAITIAGKVAIFAAGVFAVTLLPDPDGYNRLAGAHPGEPSQYLKLPRVTNPLIYRGLGWRKRVQVESALKEQTKRLTEHSWQSQAM